MAEQVVTGPAGGPSPLSLRQLEWELHQTWPNDDGLRVLYERAVTLLRLLHETRAALAEFLTPDVPGSQRYKRAAAVLGQAVE